ncbi:hypothetical protein LP419_39615 [Massilia sp. H-1]|nr:hypothetical protein LP419_39615 [Massilia sp. H-1]
MAPTINVLSETTDASVGRGATINAENGVAPGTPNVLVKASDETDIVSVAGSVAVA